MKKLAVPIILMLASAVSLFLGFTVLRSAFAGFALYYLLCCITLPLLDILVLRKIPARCIPELLGFSPPKKKDIVLGVWAGLAMAAAMLVALVVFRDVVFGDGRIGAVLKGWGASGKNAVVVYIVMLVFNGALEELFWRGYLYDRLRAMPNRFLALGLPAFFFGAQHLFVVSLLVADPAIVGLFIAGIFGAGLVWSLMRERSGGILACVISHTLVTSGYMGAFFIFGF